MAWISRNFLGAISLLLLFMQFAAGQVITEVNIGDKVVVVSETEKTLKGAPDSDILVTYSIVNGRDAKYFLVSKMVYEATTNTGTLRKGDWTYSLTVTENSTGTVILKLLGRLKEKENDLYLYEEGSNGLVLLSHIRFAAEDIYPAQFADADKLLTEAKAKGFSNSYVEIMLSNAELAWRAGDKQSAIETVNNVTQQTSDYLKEHSAITAEIAELWQEAKESYKINDVSVFLKAAEENTGRGEFQRARTEIAKARAITKPTLSGRIIDGLKSYAAYLVLAALVLVGVVVAKAKGKNKKLPI